MVRQAQVATKREIDEHRTWTPGNMFACSDLVDPSCKFDDTCVHRNQVARLHAGTSDGGQLLLNLTHSQLPVVDLGVYTSGLCRGQSSFFKKTIGRI